MAASDDISAWIALFVGLCSLAAAVGEWRSPNTWWSGRAGTPSAASNGSSLKICPRIRTNGSARARDADWFRAAIASGSHSSAMSRGDCPLRVSHASTDSPGRTGNGSPCVIARRAALSPDMMRVAARRSVHDSAFHRSRPPARCSGGASRSRF